MLDESKVEEAKPKRLAFMIASYSICSSTLLLVNKYVLQSFPVPSTILATQCFFTAFAVRCASIVFSNQNVETMSKADFRLFVVVVICFVGTLFSNAKALQYTNVDTVIGLRLTMPLITCVLEYLFLGRQLPNTRSALALFGVAGSFSFYIMENGSLPFRSVFWLGLWYSWTIFEGIFLKHVVTVSRLSTMSKTYYLNVFSMVVFAFLALQLESRGLQPVTMSDAGLLAFVSHLLLLLSCFLVRRRPFFYDGFLSVKLAFLLSREATTFS